VTAEETDRVSESFAQEKKRLLGFIRKRIPDRLEAEDILQDVFLRLLVHSTGIQTIENITAWLYTVTRNRIMDFFRKDQRSPFINVTPSSQDDTMPRMLQDIIAAENSGPEDLLEADEIWDEIESALNDMPEEQREVFILHEFENKSIKEIVALTGANQNTILARKRYAVLFLRKRLTPLYNQLKQ